MLLLLWGVAPAADATAPLSAVASIAAPASAPGSGATLQEPGAGAPEAGQPAPGQNAEAAGAPPADTQTRDPGQSVQEATGTLRELMVGFYGLLPKLGIALALLALAAVLARILRIVLRRALGYWERSEALAAVAAIVVWLLALGTALSVLAGDVRALVGSVGLLGLALSWALQAPIESFAGWLVNSFQGYYRVGDRIEVGEVFGDVYRIDFLTTTVWEAGGPDKPVQGAQPTGALVTFPNSEVLRANVVNYTRDFPFVWDEVVIGVANESDLGYAAGIAHEVAHRVLGEPMIERAAEYERLLRRRGLGMEVAAEPQVYVSVAEAWTDLTVRYLIPVRERRLWSSELQVALSRELARPEHGERVRPAYPRAEIRILSDEAPPVGSEA